MKRLGLLCVAAIHCVTIVADVIAGFEFRVGDGLRVHQEAKSENTFIVGIEDGEGGYVSLFARELKDRFNAENVFFNDVSLQGSPTVRTIGYFDWWLAKTERVFPQRGTLERRYATNFFVEEGGWLIYGTSRHFSPLRSEENAYRLLSSIRPKSRSLTGPEYTGKKYYLGWGAAMTGDPSMMHNEVKYDVNHTHDIFTKELGGGYLGTKLIGPSAVTRTAILSNWDRIKTAMTTEDMYVQYSSGHGSGTGLAVGVSYNEIRDNALSLPGREIIVFIMACYSGALVDAFNAKKSVWEKWGENGRTLMVFASSKKSQTSSTGPGTDPDEAGGPFGSAGSAFGFALWKSLIGYADGFVDGVKDGYLSLGEIEKYTNYRTYEEGGHNPVSTGVWNSGLLMNKVPPKAWVESEERRLGGFDLERSLRLLDSRWRLKN